MVPTALRTLRLKSSRAHSDRKPAVEVQQCPLRAEVGEEIGEELAEAEVDMEVEAEVVEEKEEDEEEVKEKEPEQLW